jgi:hypothetical protein
MMKIAKNITYWNNYEKSSFSVGVSLLFIAL